MNTKPSPILSRLKAVITRTFNLSDATGADFAGLVPNVTAKSGESVTAEAMLGLSAVWACTRLISQTIATLPLGVYEKTADGRQDASAKVDGLSLVKMKANRHMTSPVFWEQLVSAALLRGNGFAVKQRVGRRIVGFVPLAPERLTWQKTRGEYEFFFREDDGTRTPISDDDLMHLPGFAISGRFGVSVIQYGVEVFGTAISTNTAASSTFKNGMKQTTYFKMDRVLKGAQRTEFRTALQALTGALNAGKPVILEGGMEAGNLGINPDDAQLLESRRHSNEDICRWFGVPPAMVAAGDKASSWASSSEQMNLWFLQYGLAPWLKRIELMLWDELLTPEQKRTMYFEFNTDGLLRTDAKTRMEVYASALQNGYKNRDEVRRLENLPPIPDGSGQAFTAQSNLLPLAKIGENQQQAPAPSAAPAQPPTAPNAAPAP